MVVELVGDAASGSAAGGVTVHQDPETRDWAQPAGLGGREMAAEQGDGGDLDLVQTQDRPRPLDDDQLAWVLQPVEVVEQLMFGQAGRQLPLAVAPRVVGVEVPAGVAEGLTAGIVQAHGEAAMEESTAVVGAGFEGPGGLGPDAFATQHGVVGIESQPSGEGPKRLGVAPGLGRFGFDLGGRRGGCELGEVLSGLSVGGSIQSAHQLDDVAAGLAAGEAVPEVLVGVDDEGVGVVAAVDGAGAGEGGAPGCEIREQASVSEHSGDR